MAGMAVIPVGAMLTDEELERAGFSSGDDGGGMGAKVALILPQGSLTGQADLLLV